MAQRPRTHYLKNPFPQTRWDFSQSEFHRPSETIVLAGVHLPYNSWEFPQYAPEIYVIYRHKVRGSSGVTRDSKRWFPEITRHVAGKSSEFGTWAP